MNDLTRDAVQGFLDGLKEGKKVKNLDIQDPQTKNAISNWMKNHPQYPCDDSTSKKILDDLASYRT